MQVLLSGHVFVGWGQNAYFTEYSPSGAVLLDGKFGGKDVDSYRAFRFRWDAHPVEKPDAVLRGRTVYVSWNGATQVARWQVLAGSRVITTAAKTGFETHIVLRTAASGLVVRALDADATVLATARVRS
jgi:hypothetical protein